MISTCFTTEHSFFITYITSYENFDVKYNFVDARHSPNVTKGSYDQVDIGNYLSCVTLSDSEMLIIV